MTLFDMLWRWQFWLCGFGAATVLWVNHGPCLHPFGASNREFYREVRREIGGFIARLATRRQSLEDQAETCPELVPTTQRAGIPA